MTNQPATADLRGDALTNKNGWLVSTTWNALHYVPGVTADTWAEWWEPEHRDRGPVTAVCGRTFRADLPGVFTRMGTPRCRRCCHRLGIPDGPGVPLNDHTLDHLRAPGEGDR